jgi:hypothetical protein
MGEGEGQTGLTKDMRPWQVGPQLLPVTVRRLGVRVMNSLFVSRVEIKRTPTSKGCCHHWWMLDTYSIDTIEYNYGVYPQYKEPA